MSDVSLNATLASTHSALLLSLRGETPEDIDFSASLYASTRQAELALIPWSDAEKSAFCRMQFNAQHAHYESQYPDAHFLIIERDGARVGRVYVEQGASALLLMEITLTPEQRGRGVGHAVTTALLLHARANALPMHLHVEPSNPAKRLYDRLGFRDVETQGFYTFMVCRADPASN
ncbi:MAG: GNAT family N-acetyltransferase [Rhizobacter sp.]|nr:GNAT family N-acetyltransferase [Burkholderiales bacterium]